MLKSLKRDIVSALVMCLLAVIIALAWGSPFVDASAAYADDQAPLKVLLHKVPLKPKPRPGVQKQPPGR